MAFCFIFSFYMLLILVVVYIGSPLFYFYKWKWMCTVVLERYNLGVLILKSGLFTTISLLLLVTNSKRWSIGFYCYILSSFLFYGFIVISCRIVRNWENNVSKSKSI
jgi:hypothetical protein